MLAGRMIMPRWLDTTLAIVGLLLTMPLILTIGAVVALLDGRPILFRQRRVGQCGRTFTILKFRTMRHGGGPQRPLTVGDHDPRITPLGHWLREFKLDELPQLWNVLRGDMRLVGPRPELPEFVRLYDEVQRAVLDSPPGITDPASIFFRNESHLLAECANPEKTYVTDILPRKLAMNAEYLSHRSGWSDVGVLASTVRRAVLRV